MIGGLPNLNRSFTIIMAKKQPKPFVGKVAKDGNVRDFFVAAAAAAAARESAAAAADVDVDVEKRRRLEFGFVDLTNNPTKMAKGNDHDDDDGSDDEQSAKKKKFTTLRGERITKDHLSEQDPVSVPKDWDTPGLYIRCAFRSGHSGSFSFVSSLTCGLKMKAAFI